VIATEVFGLRQSIGAGIVLFVAVIFAVGLAITWSERRRG
jgi:hypothetical protein